MLTLLLVSVLTAPPPNIDADYWDCLDLPGVRAELKVTPEQEARIKRTSERISDETNTYWNHFQQGHEGYTKQGLSELELNLRREKLHPILTREQRKRLYEIYAQIYRAEIFVRPGAAEYFNLAPEIVEEIKRCINEGEEQRKQTLARFNTRALEQDTKPLTLKEGLEFAGSREASYNAVEAKVLSLLTRKQKAQYRALQGEKFTPAPEPEPKPKPKGT
jgi:hypothetical protein